MIVTVGREWSSKHGGQWSGSGIPGPDYPPGAVSDAKAF
jgi:hypothetical protein